MTPENLAGKLTPFSDSDYTTYPDTRRSVGGYVTILASSPILWLSRKHHTVVLYITEAEYIALCHFMQEMIFLKLLLQELDFATTQANVIHEDNQINVLQSATTPIVTGGQSTYIFRQAPLQRTKGQAQVTHPGSSICPHIYSPGEERAGKKNTNATPIPANSTAPAKPANATVTPKPSPTPTATSKATPTATPTATPKAK
ncbi:hypothetical protein ON010_g494 [Phytophthora cinnamomi]|nr:hypothetical protein ON010_g494 [Phytophthora cinnamomi]